MKWESRDTESTTLQPWPAHGNGSKLPTDSEDYAHLPVKCPRKITLYVMINPLLKGRKSLQTKVLLDISISERQE